MWAPLQSGQIFFSQWTHSAQYDFSEQTPHRSMTWPEVGSGSSPVISMCSSRNRCSVTLVGKPCTPW